MGRVAGEVTLITGDASGLGAADARLLAAQRAQVVITDVQGAPGQETPAITGALILNHDVRDEAQWEDVVAKTIAHCGNRDMLEQALAQLPADAAGLDQVNAQGQGQPEDVANLILFLASEESRQITGTQIVIDNGETMA